MMFLLLFTQRKERKKWCVTEGHLGYNQLELSN